jgi:hypothetical protein
LLRDRSRAEGREEITLLLLNRPDHLGEQAFAGAEVVDQHPVAGTDRGRDGSQAGIADAVLREVLDGVREQVVAAHACSLTFFRLSVSSVMYRLVRPA